LKREKQNGEEMMEQMKERRNSNQLLEQVVRQGVGQQKDGLFVFRHSDTKQVKTKTKWETEEETEK
jgi:hypothetical protein